MPHAFSFSVKPWTWCAGSVGHTKLIFTSLLLPLYRLLHRIRAKALLQLLATTIVHFKWCLVMPSAPSALQQPGLQHEQGSAPVMSVEVLKGPGAQLVRGTGHWELQSCTCSKMKPAKEPFISTSVLVCGAGVRQRPVKHRAAQARQRPRKRLPRRPPPRAQTRAAGGPRTLQSPACPRRMAARSPPTTCRPGRPCRRL